MGDTITIPIWLWIYYATTSTLGVFWIVRCAMRPMSRWRDRTLAKIDAQDANGRSTES